MSNRTLFEINHDFSDRIKRDPAGFAEALWRYLGSASAEHAADLTQYGVRRFGIRHHSEGFEIQWGHYQAREK